MSRIDTISPTYLGEDRIGLSLDPEAKPRVGDVVTVFLDYSLVGDAGVALPLVATARPAQERGYGRKRQVFGKRRPSSFSFLARVAGDWLVVVRESAHNRFQGRLVVSVAGDQVDRGAR